MATAPSPAQQEAAKFSQICRNCAKPTAIIEDHQQGDLVCTECGLVLESRVVDESSEWRTFSDSDKAGVDPNRTAGPTNRMLANGGLQNQHDTQYRIIAGGVSPRFFILECSTTRQIRISTYTITQ